MVRLVVGLGNPGKEYEKTRHNVGWWVVDRVAEELGLSLSREKFSALYGEYSTPRGKVFFIKPLTYMNRSGEAVGRFARFFKIQPSEILVIYDDLDLPPGALRLRLKGSSGGHKGVESVIQALGTKEFPRLRVGIGRPQRKEEVVDFVLSPFGSKELPLIEKAVEKAAGCVIEAVRRGEIEQKLINKCNTEV
ncbi:aminoacyl-tRNA hydrolase [Thermovibrio sp.]